MSTNFPYAARALEVEDAHKALRSSFGNAKKIERFYAALRAAYPADFWSHLADLRAGNTTHIETAICFLEADPVFFRSGYAKADVLRAIKRLPLTPSQMDRLRTVVLKVTATRGCREFRHYCNLARRVDGTGFREALAELLASGDPAVARRARWALSAIDQKRDA